MNTQQPFEQLEAAIAVCAEQAAQADCTATAAMQFTQAALNAANALSTLKSTQPAAEHYLDEFGLQEAALKRLQDEYDTLTGRHQRLQRFLDSAALKALDPLEQRRLRVQLIAMTNYRDVLAERIEHFQPMNPQKKKEA